MKKRKKEKYGFWLLLCAGYVLILFNIMYSVTNNAIENSKWALPEKCDAEFPSSIRSPDFESATIQQGSIELHPTDAANNSEQFVHKRWLRWVGAGSDA